MADITNVDSEQILSAIKQLDEQVAGISSSVGKIKDAIARLDKGWISGAKADFMARYQKDADAMQEMLDQYREISAQLNDTASDFDKTEQEILGDVSALR